MISWGFIFLPEMILNGVLVLEFEQFFVVHLLVLSAFMWLKSIFYQGASGPQ